MGGTNGSIAHYDGISWEKIESGTEVNLVDAWRVPDGKVVWVSGWKDFKPGNDNTI